MTDHQPHASRLAALDIGSLTVRLAIATAGTSPPAIILRRRAITRLGEDLGATGVLSPAAMDRTLAAISGYVRLARENRASALQAVATQAVRQAANGPAFLEQIQAHTGLTVTLLSPADEARLSLQGVLSVLSPTLACGRPLVVFDVGGGSTEFALFTPANHLHLASLPLGALSLTQTWLTGDPPSPASLAALRQAINELLQTLPAAWGLPACPPGCTLVGTAGSVTTLAALTQALDPYDPDRINNMTLTAPVVAHWTARLAALTTAQRAALPGLEPGKAGVMVAGAVLVEAILTYFSQDHLVVSDAGLLEGVLCQMVQQQSPASEPATPLPPCPPPSVQETLYDR